MSTFYWEGTSGAGAVKTLEGGECSTEKVVGGGTLSLGVETGPGEERSLFIVVKRRAGGGRQGWVEPSFLPSRLAWNCPCPERATHTLPRA